MIFSIPTNEVTMPEAKIALFYGDPYQCERALAAREAGLAADGQIERIVRFGDELDIKALSIEIASASLFSPLRHFLIRHVEWVKPIRSLYPLLDLPLPTASYITLISSEEKGLDTLVKKVRERTGKVQGFPRARGRALEKVAAEIMNSEGVSLTKTALAELTHASGDDLLFLREEARKLAAYSAGAQLGPNDIAEILYNRGEGSIYPFLDLFGSRDLRGAVAALSRLNADPSRLFPALLHQIIRLTEVRILKDEGFSLSEISRDLGVPEWLTRRLLVQAKHYSQKELTAALQLGIELDRQVKHGGIRTADAVLILIFEVTNRTQTSRAPVYTARTQPSR